MSLNIYRIGTTCRKAKQRLCISMWLLCILFVFSCASPVQEGIRHEPALVPDQSAAPEDDPRRLAYLHFTFASLAAASGKDNEALQHLSLAVEADPTSSFLCKRMALLCKRIGEYRKGIDFARRCLELEPADTETMTLLGDLYSLNGDDDMALGVYAELLEMEPENPRIPLLMSTILIRKGSYEEAGERLESVIAQYPDSVTAHYYLGRVRLEMKKYGRAEESFLKALELDERLEPALFDLGTLYHITQRTESAVEVYKRLLEYYPDNVTARERLVNIYFSMLFFL